LIDSFLNFWSDSVELKIKNSEFSNTYFALKEFEIRCLSTFASTDFNFSKGNYEKTHRLQNGIVNGFKSLLDTQSALFNLDMSLRNLSLVYSECLGLFKLSVIPFEFRFFQELSVVYLKNEKEYLKLIPFETISAEDTVYLFKKLFNRSLNLESPELIFEIKASFLLQAEKRSHLKPDLYWPNACQEISAVIDLLPKSNMCFQLKKCFK
jgi:hypothetical protein